MLTRPTQLTSAVCVLATLVACEVREEAPFAPDLAEIASSTCAANPEFVASDRDTFLYALHHAQPGETVAIDGMIQLDFDGNVETADLTFDCASPGSGLSAAPDVGVWLFIVKAPGVTVQNLVLDARGGYGAYLSDKNGVDAFAEGLVFRGNTVTCNSEECVFVQSPEFAFASGALVEENVIEVVEAIGGQIGIHIQGYTDVTVQRNTVRAAEDALWAVAVNGSSHVNVVGNNTSGPWGRSLVLYDGVFDSEVRSNSLAGARNHGATFEAVERIRFTDNTTECGAVACILARQGSDVRIEGNLFTSGGSATGVHTQGGLDRVQISQNRIVAWAPSTNPTFGAIRLLTGSGHTVEGNEVRGPWANGLAITDVRSSSFVRNTVSGPLILGGAFVEFHDSDFRNNLISNPGGSGLVMNRACRNVLVGNNLQLTGVAGLVLEPETGANIYVGSRSAVVDNGSFDCDGDGLVDPNVLTGQGTSLTGVPTPQVAGALSTDGILR